MGKEGSRVNGSTKPNKINWTRRVAGIASGVYGDVDKYIEKERASWDKDKPWPGFDNDE